VFHPLFGSFGDKALDHYTHLGKFSTEIILGDFVASERIKNIGFGIYHSTT